MKNVRLPVIALGISMVICLLDSCSHEANPTREKVDFNNDWRFEPGDSPDYSLAGYDDSRWRVVDLPHHRDAEGRFGRNSLAGTGDEAPTGGTGWYRKAFRLPGSDSLRRVCITFDGVSRDSEVYINGHLLGKSPNGYIGFQYDMTPWLNFGEDRNVIAIRIDHSVQPDPGGPDGSGIYRDVWVEKIPPIHFNLRGTHVTTHSLSAGSAEVEVSMVITNTTTRDETLEVLTMLMDEKNRVKARQTNDFSAGFESTGELTQKLVLNSPRLWSVEDPYLYKAVSVIKLNNKKIDVYQTTFGIPYFSQLPQEGTPAPVDPHGLVSRAPESPHPISKL